MTDGSSGFRGLAVSSGAHTALVGVEVLVLDHDERVHAGIEQLLSEASLHVTWVTEAERALAAGRTTVLLGRC